VWVCDEVDEIKADLSSLILDVSVDLDANCFELFRQRLKISFANIILSDKTEQSSGFDFSSGTCSIAGVQFADTNFSGSLKKFPLVFFGDALKVIFLHFSFSEGEVKVDIEWSEEYFIIEVGFVIEGECLFVF